MKLSVIVPIYNMEKYLVRCLDSIKSQTFTDFECIMVNDGSTDSSEQICKKYLADARFILVNQMNGGLGNARNNGIKIAKGTYISFVDSDDWIDANMFSLLIEVLEKNNCDLVCCDYKLAKAEIRPIKRKLKVRILNKREAVLDFLKRGNQGCKNNYSAWNKIYKRALLAETKFTENTLYEDMDFSSRIFQQIKKVAIINQSLYFYFQKSESITRSSLTKRNLDIIVESKKIYDSYKDDKEFCKYASNIHTRSYFSLLVRLAQGFDYPREIYTDDMILDWIKILRNNFWQMIFSCMDLRRKIAYLVICCNYDLLCTFCKKIGKFRNCLLH